MLGLEVVDREYIVFVHPVLVLSQADSYLGLVGYCGLTVDAGCAGLPAALGPQRPAGCSRLRSPALVTVGLAMYRVIFDCHSLPFGGAGSCSGLHGSQASLEVTSKAPMWSTVRFSLTFTPSLGSNRQVGP